MNQSPPRPPARRPTPARQRGIVLIVAMIMLVVISLLAAMSVRNATSSEKVTGNVRFTELANQSAEIALRVCEQAVLANVQSATPLPTNADGVAMTIQGVSTPPLYTNTAVVWDASPKHAALYPVDSTDVNFSATLKTFERRPECLVERMQVTNLANTAVSSTRSYIITARGFGPDVRSATPGRPSGTEVFLQSILELD
ncbi:hypothetical protein FN976_20290 [Caenimonas sedimenti]|uniref:Type 4 fimbrial biogenesis protein PilX N-terminal domain-containing protein n=1 Tax=Caenimonas sedimenti TaxID=2596921 RepID=A0A562ZKH1_9BURK|nr:PilX N-terminal domain-containing pilus assembly protein [Caenimonas sedimenti]TWO69080.1 hypothetical protein FN976_20290 [Caenimonas sedimenti]